MPTPRRESSPADALSTRRGILYPARLPSFTRVAAPEPVRVWVRWFWIPEWDLEPGRTSRQQLIAYPACNLVVQHDVTVLAGPSTRISHQDLRGTGWAVGALLRPAAAPLHPPGPATILDTRIPVDLPGLTAPVRAAMARTSAPETRHATAVAAFADWLLARLPEPGQEALLANAMAERLDTDPSIRTVEAAAEAMHVSPRTLQRLARTWVGLPPSAMIRRRRLQEAVETMRTEPTTDLARLATELGYADQAHLANEMRSMLGYTATGYRRGLTDDR